MARIALIVLVWPDCLLVAFAEVMVMWHLDLRATEQEMRTGWHGMRTTAVSSVKLSEVVVFSYWGAVSSE